MPTNTEDTGARASWFVGASYGSGEDQTAKFLFSLMELLRHSERLEVGTLEGPVSPSPQRSQPRALAGSPAFPARVRAAPGNRRGPSARRLGRRCAFVLQ